MAIETGTTISVAARVLSPLITDLYNTAKGGAIRGLQKWKDASFPRKLAKRIDGLGKVKTLWSPEKDISLLTFYYPPRFGVTERVRQKAIESVKDFGDGNLVIQGIVGQGKSIFLRYLAIKEATKSDSNRLPVFLELRTLHAGYTLLPAIYKTLSGYEIDINDDTFDHLAKSGKFILLLDAFDELDETLIRLTLNDIEHLNQKYPDLQIVVTSRPSNEIQKVNGFRTIHISPLTRNDYGPLLTKLGLDQAKIVDIKSAIRSSPSRLADLITTPLMLTLVVIVYESEKEIPPTLPEFFERLFQVVFTRHDRLKAGFNRKRHTGLSERRLQELFEAFCFMVIQNSFGRSLSAEQFSLAFKQALQYASEANCDEEQFRLDIIKVACLMLEEGIDTATFLHKSVLEYYAAAFIKHSTDEVAQLFYQAAEQDFRPWQEVLRFLSDIDPYRYSKEFALNQLAKIREEFIKPLEDKKDSSLLSVINTLHPQFSAEYQYDVSLDAYDLVSFGPFQPRTRLMYEAFDDLLISAMEKTLPADSSRSELEDIVGYYFDDDITENSPQVNLSRAIAFGGSDEFWAITNIFAGRIEQMEMEAKAIIAEQEKRKLIFQKSKFNKS